MPYRQFAPVPIADFHVPRAAPQGGSAKRQLLTILQERRRRHLAAARDESLKVGARVDADARARECKALTDIVQALRGD